LGETVPKSKEKTSLKPPKKQDQILEAYYMLARVVSQNTQMFEAVFNSLNHIASSQNADNQINTAKVINSDDKEKLVEVLSQIVEKCGKEKAISFMDSFDAKTVSEVAPANYEVFIKSGEYLIKHYQGDVI